MKPGTAAISSLALIGLIMGVATLGTWNSQAHGQGKLVAPGLVLPRMNPQAGKALFAGKGCVVCHQVNGVGGTDAAALDADTMDPVMSPFDFFAKMWLGAEPMIAMQKEEIGGQIEFTGQDLADIIAFVHNRAVQRTFSEDDIPDEIKELMEGHSDEGTMRMHMEGGEMIGHHQ